MKIQIASDLHLEFLARRFPSYRAVEVTDADVLVLAGDIHHHDFAAAAFRNWPCPVVLLHGNHEFYGSSPEVTVPALAASARNGGDMHYLENATWCYQNVRFVGCCLWTDYALYGDRAAAMDTAARVLMDHRQITTHGRAFMPADALNLHLKSLAWLRAELARPFDGRTVVCTHHAPCPQSIHVNYSNDPLNPCFISDISELLDGVNVWVHGHVHNSFDYMHGNTRVLANPRGYALNLRRVASIEEIDWENRAFNPALVIEL